MIESWLLMYALTLVRVAACIAFLPAPFGRGVPTTVKVGLSAAIAWFCLKSVSPASAFGAWKLISSSSGWFWLGYLTARETALGYLLAWLAGLVVIPARLAGAYIAQEMGLSLGAIASPLDQQPSNLVANILDSFTTILILGLNLHYVWIWTLNGSLQALPVGSVWKLPSPQAATLRLAHAEQLGLASIGPIIVMMFLVLVLVMIATRLSPQTNLFNFGMPLRAFLGLLGMLLFLPEILVSLARAAELLQITSGGWRE